MISEDIKEKMKKLAAREAMKFLKDDIIVGLGTGSTARYAIEFIAENEFDVICVATSKESERLAISLGLRVMSPNEVEYVDITIDGADEVDKEGNLIKGYGGALTREKIIAKMSKEEIIIVDETKLVQWLGQKGKLPVEILSFGWKHTMKALESYGRPTLRKVGKKPFITDNGNYIVDLSIDRVNDPKKWEVEINSIPGVVENGIFTGLATKIIVAYRDGKVRIFEL